jgi:hypothetical protein
MLLSKMNDCIRGTVLKCSSRGEGKSTFYLIPHIIAEGWVKRILDVFNIIAEGWLKTNAYTIMT